MGPITMKKISYYTIWFSYPEFGKVIYYNSLSNASILVPINTHKEIQSLPKIFDQKELSYGLKNLFSSFTDLRLIVESDLDEKELLVKRLDLGRHQRKKILATVAPTNQCNFRCTYCFEPHNSFYLSDELWTSFVDFLSAEAEMTELNLTWFGGEPLLCAGRMQKWTSILRRNIDDRNIKYNASIVTNGYLLNAKNVKILEDIGVGRIQVTLDGPREIHDERRMLTNGHGSYNRIIDNLATNMDKLRAMNVYIRVNVDRRNLESTFKLIDDLVHHGLHKWCKLYFARLENPTEYCGNIKSMCFPSEEFSRIKVKLREYMMSRGFDSNEYPSLMLSYCGADNDASFTMDAEGYLYKCWHEVGVKQLSFGHIDDRNATRTEFGKKYRVSNLIHESYCSECKYLPICMGGCPFYWKQNDGEEIHKKLCTEHKTNLKEQFKLTFKNQLTGETSTNEYNHVGSN